MSSHSHEVKRQVWCLLQVKLCDPCLSALEWFVYHTKRYTSARIFFSNIEAYKGKWGKDTVHSDPEKNCTKFNAPSFCNRLQQNHAVFTKMLSKDNCLPGNAKFVSVG